MKKMKKVLALALTMVMMFAMGMTAMATENTEKAAGQAGAGTTYTISLADGKTVPTGHTYEIYQIFKGKVSEVTKDGKTVKVLTDIEWGTNYGPIDGTTAETAAKGITDANAFAEEIAESLSSPVAEIKAGEGSTTVTESGYYLIKDVSTVTGQQDTVSSFMVELGGDIVITPKVSEVPDFKKEINDSNKTAFDYEAGESVPFALTATLKSDVAEADTYQLTFHDTLNNLTFQPDSVKVFYKLPAGTKTEVTNDKWTVSQDGNSFTVAIPDVKAFGEVGEGTDIIVEYSAILSAEAFAGNVADNKASLNFGRDGNSQGIGSTNEVEVKLYTFALKFDKVDEDNQPLEGAGFTLFAENGTTVVRGEVTGGTAFEFQGLKAGTYVLKETTVPAGYNSLEDVTIILEASEADGVITPSITASGWTAKGTGDNADGDNAYTFGTTITNYAGVQLPSTGGIGTTIFYVVGGIMVLGAAVLLITKKRMSARN